MGPLGLFLGMACRLGLEVMCRVDKSDLHKVPQKGPVIAYSNHTGSIEVPLIFTEFLPRPVTGIAKVETWNGWFLRFIFNQWNIIPIHRGEADMAAMRKALEALKKGYILGIAPEGTRNKTGAMIKAQPGIFTLAQHSGATMLPMGNWGGENFLKNLKKLKRTDFTLRVGEPFKIDTRGERITGELRQKITDEMMYKVAALLPEKYRGVYGDLENATEKYLEPV
jgi:1-acyl-sn-glycerol-3-phosphate acyltransferase